MLSDDETQRLARLGAAITVMSAGRTTDLSAHVIRDLLTRYGLSAVKSVDEWTPCGLYDNPAHCDACSTTDLCTHPLISIDRLESYLDE